MLGEECNETAQAVSKILRFGLLETHPVTGVSNKEHLSEEVGQLLGMLDLATEHGLLDWYSIERNRAKKPIAFEKYAQTERA